MNELLPDISVIVCTRDGADSLRLTLECLASARREGILTEVVVVDNAGSDSNKEVVASYRGRFPIQYRYQPKPRSYGKRHRLKRERGVAGTDAAAGHRIQPRLLQRDVALDRARKTGVCYAQVRLRPYRQRVKQARLLHTHPLLGRLFCLLNHLRWRFLYLTSYLYP